MASAPRELANLVHIDAMSDDKIGVPLRFLMTRSGVSFFTRRVIQRWARGEISTDTAVELIQTDEAERLIEAWMNGRA